MGGVHGDGVREIMGQAKYLVAGTVTAAGTKYSLDGTGVFGASKQGSVFGCWYGAGGYSYIDSALNFSAARIVPTSNKVQGRAWGALACVYLGAPR